MWGTIAWIGIVLVICGSIVTCNYNDNQTAQKAFVVGYIQIPNPANSSDVIWVKGK